MPKLEVIRLKGAMIKLCKVAKSYRRLYGGSGGAQDCTLTLSNICKVLRRCRSDFEMLRLLVFNKSLSNLAMLIILRPSFQWCLEIFPNLSTSKIKKKPCKGLFENKARPTWAEWNFEVICHWQQNPTLYKNISFTFFSVCYLLLL